MLQIHNINCWSKKSKYGKCLENFILTEAAKRKCSCTTSIGHGFYLGDFRSSCSQHRVLQKGKKWRTCRSKSNSKLDTVSGEAMNQEINTHTDISDGKSASWALWKRPVTLLNPAVMGELCCSSQETGWAHHIQQARRNHCPERAPDHNYFAN